MISTILLGLGTAGLLLDTSTTLPIDDADEIVVTGSPLARTVGDSVANPVSVIDSDELERVATTTLGDALRKQPGIASTYFGAGASRPIIRGQGGDRVRILDNGIGSIDASAASPDHAVAASPATAQRVEIVRGSGLLRYGSSAAGGVVNVIDGRLLSERPETGVEGGVRVGLTTVDDGEDAAGAITFDMGEWGGVDVVGHVSGSWRQANDFDIPGYAESSTLRALEEAEEEEHEDEDEDHDHEEEEEQFGTLENSFVDSSSIAAGLSFIGDRGFFSFAFKRSDSEYGLPGGHGHGHEEEHEEEGEEHDEDEHSEEEEEENVFIDLEQTRFDINAGLELDGFFEAVNLYAGVADYQHIEFEGPGEPGTVFDNEGWEARIELLQRESDGWRGATGLQYRDREFSAVGEEAFVPPTESTQVGIYTFQEITKGPWTLEGALRYETTEHTRSTDGFSVDFDGVSVSAGATYDLGNGWRFGGNGFRTERAPITEELFANGPHLATEQFEIGDPTLDIETGTGLELGARKDWDNGHIAVNVYRTEYDDYIFEAATGEEEDELPVFQFGAADATFQGVEVESELAFGSIGAFDLSGDLVADLVEVELDVTGNDNLPRLPPKSLTVGVDAQAAYIDLRAEVEHAAEQDSIANFELPTDGYTLTNLYATWRPYGQDSLLSVNAGLLNAFDEEAREHASFLKDTVPLPGRNFRLSVGYRF